MHETDFRDEPTTSPSMLVRARQGDAESWSHLAHLYGPVIYGWARRLGCQSADAADIMQETLSSVSRALSRFDDQRENATFRGWLWTIARNKIRDRVREAGEDLPQGGTQAQLALAGIADQRPIQDDQPPTEADQDAADVKRRMVELLRQDFDPRTWQMFWETTVIQRPPVDVAQDMGVSKWAVYKARARVLQRLRQELDGLQ